ASSGVRRRLRLMRFMVVSLPECFNGHVHIAAFGGRLRDRVAVLLHSLEMEGQSLGELLLGLLQGIADGGTAWDIGRLGRIAGCRLVENCCVTHSFTSGS